MDTSPDVLIGRPYGHIEEYQSHEVIRREEISVVGCGYPIRILHGGVSGYLANGYTVAGVYLTNGYFSSLAAATTGRGLRGTACPRGTHGDSRYSACRDADGNIISNFTCTYLAGRVVTGAGRHATYRDVYGYVTRTRTTSYDKESGLFSIGIGVPYPALNKALFSTRQVKRITINDYELTRSYGLKYGYVYITYMVVMVLKHL